MTMISLLNIRKSLGGVCSILDISFQLKKGDCLALTGRTGSGKTTLLRLIAGLETVDSGDIQKEGSVGLVFQSLALWPHVNIRNHIDWVLESKIRDRGERMEQTNRLMSEWGLMEWAERKPTELSGGQQQRVAIARAMAVDPEILLMDEPFSHLDTQSREEIQNRLRPLLSNRVTIIATHDKEEIETLSTKCLRLGS
jgi:ABC-type sulfate/molybdate transport systems ATPase subunit